jgi:ABC-type Fe3+/spermidine/putrescine transport system ATPase subunit
MTTDLAIDVAGLSKSFDGKTACDLTPGRARPDPRLFGPNGSGKDTSIRMLAACRRTWRHLPRL